MFAGLISLTEYVAALMRGSSYFYIGELFAIICYFYPYNFLQIILEIKYVYFCRKNLDMKNEEEMIACFCFLEEILFPDCR